MIEKIHPDQIVGLDGLPTTIMPDSAKLMRKINEIIDVIYDMQLAISSLDPDSDWYDDPIYHEAESADQYAKQRKALEIAVDALKYANKCIKGGCVNWETEIDKALDKITALEQKDVK